MEIVGKILHVLPLQSGTSKAGNQWKKQEYVLETEDAYPKKICFDFFGDRVDQFPLQINDRIKLSFDLESREYQGRWYTSVRGWKSEPADNNNPAAQPSQVAAPPMGTPAAPPAPADFLNEDPSSSDDLPF